MTKSKNSRPSNPVWVLVEHDGELHKVLGAFSDESSAHETREFCQRVTREKFETDTPFYAVVELPLRKNKMSLAAIIANTDFPETFSERKKVTSEDRQLQQP